MKMHGRGRLVRRAVAGLAVAVAVAGCGGDEPDVAAEASTAPAASPSPSPRPEPSPEQPPEALVKAAWVELRDAIEAEDARSAVQLLDDDTMRYLKELQRTTVTAGPAQVARLTSWKKLVLTFLRTEHSEDLLGSLSTTAFFDYVIDYKAVYLPEGKIDPRRVRVHGSRGTASFVTNGGARLTVPFEIDGDSVDLDARELFEWASGSLESLADSRGKTPDEMILELADDITLASVPPDVWDKP